MKRLVALLPLFLVSCASTAGTWPASERAYPFKRETLQAAVRASLEREGWVLGPDAGPDRVLALKWGAGGHVSIVDLLFVDAEGNTAFEVWGGSQNRGNWVTLGLLGYARRERARQAILEWLDHWDRTYPRP